MAKMSKRGRYTPPKRPFERAEMQVANEQCGSLSASSAAATTENVVFDNCPICDHRVMLHCSGCKVQVTGCTCTMRESMTAQEIRNAELLEHRRKTGLWVPGQD